MNIPFLNREMRRQIGFELRSWLGRRKSRPFPLEKNEVTLINLGAGTQKNDPFIGIDCFGSGALYEADLRYPLSIPNETIDGIFSEHAIEHLTYDEAARLIRECYRILKPHSPIRIVVPDVSLFAINLAEENAEWFRTWEKLMFLKSSDPERAKRRLHSPMMALSFVTQEYGHRSSWDFQTLQFFLKEAGFKDIKKQAYLQGDYPKLHIDTHSEDRKLVSLYMEARK